MDPNLQNNIRDELLKIKELKKNASKKLTAEDIKSLPAFKQYSIEKCNEILGSLKEYARIVLTFLNRKKDKDG